MNMRFTEVTSVELANVDGGMPTLSCWPAENEWDILNGEPMPTWEELIRDLFEK